MTSRTAVECPSAATHENTPQGIDQPEISVVEPRFVSSSQDHVKTECSSTATVGKAGPGAIQTPSRSFALQKIRALKDSAARDQTHKPTAASMAQARKASNVPMCSKDLKPAKAAPRPQSTNPDVRRSSRQYSNRPVIQDSQRRMGPGRRDSTSTCGPSKNRMSLPAIESASDDKGHSSMNDVVESPRPEPPPVASPASRCQNCLSGSAYSSLEAACLAREVKRLRLALSHAEEDKSQLLEQLKTSTTDAARMHVALTSYIEQDVERMKVQTEEATLLLRNTRMSD
ncbi:hypothetical protein EDC01DRAFT_634134 [Geopyxis carbonaria]|nr:hypothetical protein EDC01DRAFT_634134 [Geopyxis carbonaria]